MAVFSFGVGLVESDDKHKNKNESPSNEYQAQIILTPIIIKNCVVKIDIRATIPNIKEIVIIFLTSVFLA